MSQAWHSLHCTWSQGLVALLALSALPGLRAPKLAAFLQKNRAWEGAIFFLASVLVTISAISFASGAGPLVVGLFLVTLDLTVRSIHVISQGRVVAFKSVAASRLNSLYATVYFLGAAIGFWLGGLSASLFGWAGFFHFPAALATLGVALLYSLKQFVEERRGEGVRIDPDSVLR